jgi:hypothetical protein
MQSLEIRKERLSLNRTSLRADMLNERSKGSGIDFLDLMQADFVLFIREAAYAVARGTDNRWYPATLVYVGHRSAPFEIFARARSTSYFQQIAPMLGLASLSDLTGLLGKFGTGAGAKLYLPSWGHFRLSPQELMDADRIGTLA